MLCADDLIVISPLKFFLVDSLIVQMKKVSTRGLKSFLSTGLEDSPLGSI